MEKKSQTETEECSAERQKNVLEGLKFLAETQRKQFLERRKYDWRLVYAVALFFVSSIYVLIKYPNLEVHPLCILPYLVITCFCVVYFNRTAMANNKNKDLAEKVEYQITEVVNKKGVIPDPENEENRKAMHPLQELGWICVSAFIISLFLIILLLCSNRLMFPDIDLIKKLWKCLCW